MAKDERLNEEAARNNNTPPVASTEVLETLNELNDRNKQLPKSEKQEPISEEKKKSYTSTTNRRSDNNDEAYPRYS